MDAELQAIKNEMGYSNMEDAEFLEMAEDLDNLDAEDLDDLDDAEYAEYAEYAEALEMAERKLGKRKVAMAKRAGKKKFGIKSTKGTKRKLSPVGGGGSWTKQGLAKNSPPTFGTASYINLMMTQSKGDLNITITRQSANIASPLPVVLFGLQGFASSYVSMIKQYLPAGTVMVASTDANGDVLLTYTSGANVDIVRITLTGSQISYSEFLQSMNQNYFKTRYIRQEYVNDANLLSAVSQTINFGLLSALGSKNQNNLLPRSRRLNSDYQTFIVNLFLPEQKITSDFSFVQNIIAVANQVIAYDVFMSDRTNLNNL